MEDLLRILGGSLPLLAPLLLLDLALAVAAVRSVLRRDRFRFGSRGVWLAVSIVVLLFGPVLYFLLGRDDS